MQMNFLPEFTQVLTMNGWVEITDWVTMQGKAKAAPVCLLYKDKLIYAPPVQFDKIMYKGPLLKLDTNCSEVVIKGATSIVTSNGPVKGKDLQVGDHLTRYHMSQIIEKIERVAWEGAMYSLFFGEPAHLPIKYDSDYILIPV